MNRRNAVNSFYEEVGDASFYCELRGSGPTLVLIPSGEGDCGSFTLIADLLAQQFSVFTLDMRGCSRSSKPTARYPITPELLAFDVAALVDKLDLAPASFYGCSSGGQTCLALGHGHAEIVRNLMVHEASLLLDAPPFFSAAQANPKSMCQYFVEAINGLVEQTGSRAAAFNALLRSLAGNDAFEALGPEYQARVSANADVWIEQYVPHAANTTYSQLALKVLPPTTFSVGALSPAWIADSNLRLAKRFDAEVVWMPPPCMHFPQLSNPTLLVEYISQQVGRYL